ncbi:hypothetical protein [Lachnoclostridium phytofermentans]|uniref:Type IV pilin n=1 Tax=Lachnoclostridium phytofermentans (strain ATCC 700394 / DSM 18823 / ISDg) TaxID=357809 RepID=A9KKE4_LACP7|nr:hypothetical protein [Lachnoclostridium phytofermentans]ABX44135.1 hypothetical protein Cphy_3788 [Lachnoclostridium phytofermentans ISDg]
MPVWAIVMLVILAILVVLFVALLIYGRKMQKKQEASQEDIRNGAQSFSILVIDKKRMRIKDAGFPQIVLDQTPKYLRRAKVPVVKAKIGPKVATLMCEEKVFDLIPIKKEIKAVINGIYILDVKGLRGGLEQRPVKQSFFKKMKSKITKKN